MSAAALRRIPVRIRNLEFLLEKALRELRAAETELKRLEEEKKALDVSYKENKIDLKQFKDQYKQWIAMHRKVSEQVKMLNGVYLQRKRTYDEAVQQWQTQKKPKTTSKIPSSIQKALQDERRRLQRIEDERKKPPTQQEIEQAEAFAKLTPEQRNERERQMLLEKVREQRVKQQEQLRQELKRKSERRQAIREKNRKEREEYAARIRKSMTNQETDSDDSDLGFYDYDYDDFDPNKRRKTKLRF